MENIAVYDFKPVRNGLSGLLKSYKQQLENPKKYFESEESFNDAKYALMKQGDYAQALLDQVNKKSNEYHNGPHILNDFDYIQDCIKYLQINTKKRNFNETIDLQIGLQDYDPKSDYAGEDSITLRYADLSNKVAILPDEGHHSEIKNNGYFKEIDVLDPKDTKNWNGLQYYDFVIMSSYLAQRYSGKELKALGEKLKIVNHEESLFGQVVMIRQGVTFQLKKSVALSVPVGKRDMKDFELASNISTCLNFLEKELKYGWFNFKTVHIKSSMGKPVRMLGPGSFGGFQVSKKKPAKPAKVTKKE